MKQDNIKFQKTECEKKKKFVKRTQPKSKPFIQSHDLNVIFPFSLRAFKKIRNFSITLGKLDNLPPVQRNILKK